MKIERQLNHKIVTDIEPEEEEEEEAEDDKQIGDWGVTQWEGEGS